MGFDRLELVGTGKVGSTVARKDVIEDPKVIRDRLSDHPIGPGGKDQASPRFTLGP